MAMNRAQFAKELQEGLNAVFGLEYRDWPEEWKYIFDVEKANKAYEEDVLIQGFGAAPVKEEGAAVQYDSGSELWTARYVVETIALAFAITEEAEEDGLYGSLGRKYAKALARSMQYTKEVKGANVLNNGFNASFNGGDGKSLFALDHPLGGGGSWQNKLTTPADLHEASLEDINIGISRFVDERDIPVAVMPRCLIVPPELKYQAERITMSHYRPGTADNDVNALYQLGDFPDGVKINHYLTDKDAYFVKTNCPEGMKHFRRVKLTRKVEGEFESGNMRYRARERYVFGWTNPRAMYASEGAGS